MLEVALAGEDHRHARFVGLKVSPWFLDGSADPEAQAVLISDQGTLVRTRAAEVARVGRNTQGVTLIRLPEEEKLIGVVRVDSLNGDDAEETESADAPQPTA